MNKLLQLLFAFARPSRFLKPARSLFILLTLCCFHSSAFAGLNDGLVAYYPFNGNANDESGNNLNGIENGTINYVQGKIDKALKFDGISTYINAGNSSLFNVNQNSIVAWVNYQKNLSGYGYTIVGKVNPWVYETIYLGIGTDGTLSTGFATDSEVNHPLISQIVSTEEWHLVALTYTGNYANFYIDGVLKDKYPRTGTVRINTNDLAIGRHGGDTNQRGHDVFFNGLIDELRIYNRALTDSEVAELYAQGTTPSTNPLGELVDIEQSTIDYETGKIKIVLKNTPPKITLPKSYPVYQVIVKIGDETIANVEKVTQKTMTFDFQPKAIDNNQQDKLVSIDFYSGAKITTGSVPFYTQGKLIGTLYGVTDPIRLAHTPYNPAILASRTLSQTKPHTGNECITANNLTSECNNYFASDELAVSSKNVAIQNTLTHRIVDFDKLVDSRLINNDFKIIDNKAIYDWADSDYGKRVSKESQLDGSTVKTTGDNNRIPLLLIHGWQGSNGLRNPAQLGLWENSELHYFQHFLDYYLTSPALQQKYHIYLYHYPSYKHVTYNAFILNQLLQEIGRDYPNTDLGRVMTTAIAETPFFPLQDYKTDPQNSLTIVAHSMGGMLARSLLEEYQGLGAGMEKLNQLITLDTPHHGSTGSNPASWLNKVPKDLLTQGALDLNWDNYDSQVSNDVMNTINTDYRWVADKGNNANFDKSYCENINCNLTMNPWLLSLNTQFESDYAELAKNKYVLYVAWMSDWALKKSNTSLNPIDNGIGYNFAEKVGIPNLPNGVAEPITSALLSKFDTTMEKTLPFNPSCKAYLPALFYPNIIKPAQADDFYSWYLFNETLLPKISNTSNYNCDTPINSYQIQQHSILISTENVINYMAHPYNLPYRIFWDYDHEKMVNGAYLDNLGVWDKFINKKITVLASDIHIEDSAFFINPINNYSLRNDYIFAASSYRGTAFNINNNPIYNPLKTEPLFLVLERDLLLPKLTVTNSTVDFGKIADVVPLTSELSLSNNGIGDLMLNQSNFSLSGKDAALFKVAASCPRPMTTAQTCKLTLTFTPPAKPWLGGYFSAKNATLTIKSNDRDNPTLKVTLKAQLN